MQKLLLSFCLFSLFSSKANEVAIQTDPPAYSEYPFIATQPESKGTSVTVCSDNHCCSFGDEPCCNNINCLNPVFKILSNDGFVGTLVSMGFDKIKDFLSLNSQKKSHE